MTDLFTTLKNWAKGLADDIQENFGDPYIAAALRDDLGLKPGEDIPAAQKDQIKQYGDGLDADKTGFAETIDDLKNIFDAFKQLGEQLSADPNSVDGWDIAYLLGKLFASEMIRTREPLVYTIGKATQFITDDPEQITEFDPALLMRLARGDPPPEGFGEELTERLSALFSVIVGALEIILDKYAGPHTLDAYYGWDSAPNSPTPVADMVSGRTMTMIFTLPKIGDVVPKLALTMLGVPPEHGGPGLFLSLGGSGAYEQPVERTTFKFEAGAASAIDIFIGFKGSPHKTEVGSGASGFARLTLTQNGKNGEPAFRIGEKNKTRLDIGKMAFGIDFNGESAGFRIAFKDAQLVIKLGDGDGFLQKLPGTEINIGFGIGLVVDSKGGLRVDGGTQIRATIPVEKSLGGVLEIHTVDLALTRGKPGYDMGLEMSTSFALNIGPFRASVDRIGLMLSLKFADGNLGFLNADMGFKPPNGLGMVLDAGIVKGGGYLFFDYDRGEYAGALELKFASWGIKAIGILTTKMPDGGSGWALLLLIYADLPRIHIAFGIFFEGVGGMIGIHHTVDLQALQDGMPKGVFDDILFPPDPVKDAPRIINRLRVIFPIQRNTFLIGVMFRLSWGTPKVGEVILGVIVAIDNLLGGDRPISLSKILIIGQVRIGLPEPQKGHVVRLIIDFMAYLDFDHKRFVLFARLRDSKLVSVLELTGSLYLLIDYGDNPQFLVAVGGVHPKFPLPEGAPPRAALTRMGVKFKIGDPIELSVQCYFAVSSATFQFGVEVKITVDIKPVFIEGYIGFDALIQYRPDFKFMADFRAGMTIKVFGQTLVGVSVEGSISGPGLWTIEGTGKISLFLIGDISFPFHEQWGDKPAVPSIATNVALLMAKEYSNPANWTAQLPSGADTLVTLSAQQGEKEILAHPLGELRVTQKIAPLNLTLEKYGEGDVDGANRFELTEVKIGNAVIPNPVRTQEHMARGQFVKLNDQQKISQPSFEKFDVGIAVGTGDYSVSSVSAKGDLNYETKYLIPGEGDNNGLLKLVIVKTALFFGTAQSQAKMGGAASAGLRKNDALRPETSSKLSITEPALTAVTKTDLTLVAGIASGEAADTNFSIMTERVKASGLSNIQLVENFELDR